MEFAVLLEFLWSLQGFPEILYAFLVFSNFVVLMMVFVIFAIFFVVGAAEEGKTV